MQCMVLQSIFHFNRTMLEIQRDIDMLTDYSAIGFDGLPEYLQPVLASVDAGIMPKRWRQQEKAGVLPISLEQGFQGQLALFLIIHLQSAKNNTSSLILIYLHSVKIPCLRL